MGDGIDDQAVSADPVNDGIWKISQRQGTETPREFRPHQWKFDQEAHGVLELIQESFGNASVRSLDVIIPRLLEFHLSRSKDDDLHAALSGLSPARA